MTPLRCQHCTHTKAEHTWGNGACNHGHGLFAILNFLLGKTCDCMKFIPQTTV